MKTARIFPKVLPVVLLLLLACVFAGCSSQVQESSGYPSGQLAVSFLDVGQGDCSLIRFPDGQSMLIDCGSEIYGDIVTSYIKNAGMNSIDYLVATHPHEDHIGGMEEVVKSFNIGNIYMPKVSYNTETYESLLNTIANKGLKVKTAKAGVNILTKDDLQVDIIAPVSSFYEDINAYSAIIKITYGNTGFIFTGDAGKQSEKEITADVSADVVKVGHHGSNDASGASFVQKTGARYAVFSVGEGNSYGHPHKETVERWQAAGAEILRTDLEGTIVIISDGTNIAVSTAQNGELDDAKVSDISDESTDNNNSDNSGADINNNEQNADTWVLNTNSKKIHLPSCSSVADIKAANYALSDKSIEQLESEGYTRCQRCLPSD